MYGSFVSNECDPHHKNGCLLITKDTFTILSSGITTCIYDNKKINTCNERNVLYKILPVEDAITKAVKLGGISLNDSIAIITKFPDIVSLKLLIQSGINTVVTMPPDSSFKTDYNIEILDLLNIILLCNTNSILYKNF